ncbi:hypothetical protein MNQ95_08480 [Pseudoxanthomonas daejeonensis]|uniref:Uncharacterized protein n=1 Tax=Pseudoxanthomonas daejeonensis TaxID=266062 RepID=A0ABQ6Z7K4_9GAMM|nr:hypothetical protein [Pseudoxanthomonas daejeonensis]KAF1695015.1 hypothetical protein CSC65_07295 [Pseudoxanthomonas daejeonensis]UNK56214.1 hypothetical protein MNQ95_08480 [Pseudoxanthomonas daejeonensis]
MATRVQKKRLSIELGDGIVIDVDIKPVLSGTVVPKPPPRKVARVVVNMDDHGDWKSMALGLEIEVSVAHRKVKG